MVGRDKNSALIIVQTGSRRPICQPDSLPPVDQVLMQLVERLDLNPALQPRVINLKTQLSQGIIQADIVPMLTELLELVEQPKVQAQQEQQNQMLHRSSDQT